MMITNMIKVAGCALMFFSVHPLAAYAWSASARLPIRRQVRHPHELLRRKAGHRQRLDRGLTVGSIILGFVVAACWSHRRWRRPAVVRHAVVDTGSTRRRGGRGGDCLHLRRRRDRHYGIPDTGARYAKQSRNALRWCGLRHCVATCGATSSPDLAGVTTLFWAPARRCSSSS